MQPFYDPMISYDDNYAKGPFGDFTKMPSTILNIKKKTSFLGTSLDIPFGIPAGPLLNGRFVEAAWNWGYCLNTYKTVRSDIYPCHPFPNVIRVRSASGDIKPGETVTGNFEMNYIDITKEGITNSFAVPSKPSEYWQKDVKNTLKKMKPGNTMILSFMGTQRESMDRKAYIDDFVLAAKQSIATGAPIIEVNFSCPNFGKEGLICNDVDMSRDILTALKNAIGNTPLLVKIGYFDQSQRDSFEKLLNVIYENAQGVVAINTIQAKVVNDKGEQALPGSPVRLYSGICGATIRWAGIETAERIMALKRKNNWKDFVVVGVGGVTTPEDYWRYMKLGVSAVQSATGAMWQPDLAIRIRSEAGAKQ